MQLFYLWLWDGSQSQQTRPRKQAERLKPHPKKKRPRRISCVVFLFETHSIRNWRWHCWKNFGKMFLTNEPCNMVQGVSEHSQKTYRQCWPSSCMICEPYNATLEDGFLFCVLTTQFFSKLFRSLFRQHSTPYHERPTCWSKTEARPVNNMRLMR